MTTHNVPSIPAPLAAAIESARERFSAYRLANAVGASPESPESPGALFLVSCREAILSEIEEIGEESTGDAYADLVAYQETGEPSPEEIEREALAGTVRQILGAERIPEALSSLVSALSTRAVWSIAADLGLWESEALSEALGEYRREEIASQSVSDLVRDAVSETALSVFYAVAYSLGEAIR